ncbi:hypothetical protein B0H17DRAFT_474402 [Mycena rosella]|uniref:HTH APSES-type domain-containing protein n=1 Tax=Mycena rosella TaxID=1033263 RepID=A0AAD7DL02_MYCRO|nr:hypothetical protein B0H17DRAFT_474402 [Mycena rosella]
MNSPHESRPPPQHTYGTRIRHNIRIKPSPRRCQSPAPTTHHRRARSDAHDPVFPPPHVVLHPDDANSKVFLALGRSLMSVVRLLCVPTRPRAHRPQDNRAMTIKDLADMTVLHGLVCQNVSAASQAITTYIRTHMQRCESQQDHPLLLRHTLSGTPDDDDLLPALHSRSGGAHCGINTDNRTTNFRRGTMVWYLSGATGAPCPFARAGIMLCEYGENGRIGSHSGPRDKKKQRDPSVECGQKRKRSLRGCAPVSDSESSVEARPPPKIKLTLRLKPLRAFASTIPAPPPPDDSDNDDSMSDDSSDDDDSDDGRPEQPEEAEQPWSLPPYPRRSISIPCYTPAVVDGPSTYFHPPQTPYQRSASVPHSVASLPPDSEDDNDDYHISMTGGRPSSARRFRTPAKVESDWDQWDADDSEGDGETMWESPGPRSPSAPVLTEVAVKQEPRDSWDDFGSDTRLTNDVKVEAIDAWNWQSRYADGGRHWADEDEHIKQEDDLDSLSSSFDNFRDSMPGPSSPLSPLPSSTPLFDFDSPRCVSDPTWRDSDTPELESEWLDNRNQFSTVRPRAKTVPSFSSFFSAPGPFVAAAPALGVRPDPPLLVTQTLASLIQTMSMSSPTSVSPPSMFQPSCISPQETRCNGWSSDMVVVHTCLPCTPAISATQIEGISVYQMTLGTFTLLRRLDTDFVNLSPIVSYSGAPHPVLSTIPNATTISRGSPAVAGTWVPLSAAQAYVRDHPLPNGVLDVFLSDTLFERFPSALQDFHKSSSSGRTLNQFGPHFGTTLQATQLCSQSERREPDDAALLAPATPALPSPNPDAEAEQPLSSTEQEMFRELCITTDWDKDAVGAGLSPPPSPLSDVPDSDSADVPRERSGRPLRRSKRVADAMIAAQSRTRSRRRT